MKKILVLIVFLLFALVAGASAQEPTITPYIETMGWESEGNNLSVTIGIVNPDRVEVCSLDLIFRMKDFQYIDYQSHSSGLTCSRLGGDKMECFQGQVLFADGRLFTLYLEGSGTIEYIMAIRNTECDPFDWELDASDWSFTQIYFPVLR